MENEHPEMIVTVSTSSGGINTILNNSPVIVSAGSTNIIYEQQKDGAFINKTKEKEQEFLRVQKEKAGKTAIQKWLSN